jgi:hypothetical protein
LQSLAAFNSTGDFAAAALFKNHQQTTIIQKYPAKTMA